MGTWSKATKKRCPCSSRKYPLHGYIVLWYTVVSKADWGRTKPLGLPCRSVDGATTTVCHGLRTSWVLWDTFPWVSFHTCRKLLVYSPLHNTVYSCLYCEYFCRQPARTWHTQHTWHTRTPGAAQMPDKSRHACQKASTPSTPRPRKAQRGHRCRPITVWTSPLVKNMPLSGHQTTASPSHWLLLQLAYTPTDITSNAIQPMMQCTPPNSVHCIP